MYLQVKDGISEAIKLKGSERQLLVPGCILYSRGGMVPHMTSDNLTRVTKENFIWSIPLATIYEQPGLNVMERFGDSFHKFSSTEDVIYILNGNDSYHGMPGIYQYNEEKSISIWAPGGRRKITPEVYMKYLTTFRFNICIPPSDNIPECTAKKRCQKSTARTLKFLDKCLEIKNELKLSCPVLGAIEGGSSPYEREKCAKEVAARNVDGYVLSGFDRLQNSWKELLQKCLMQLEADKVKIMFGIFTPVEVVEAVELGVHLFDTVIAYDVTSRDCALSFKFSTKKRHIESSAHSQNETNGVSDTEESNKIKIKNLSEYEINLKKKRYFEDQSPVVCGCSCYCCTRYVRAYIHHLLVTKEMLAQVLLMTHNLHHWLSFLEEVRNCHKKNMLNDLKHRLLSKS